MTTPTTAFDPAAYLDTEERRDGFLREALATNDAPTSPTPSASSRARV